ncbi:hypothetical protein ACOME3_010267 [Neoechinorhynchus agilis]
MQSLIGLCDWNDRLRLMVVEALEFAPGILHSRWAQHSYMNADESHRRKCWDRAIRAIISPTVVSATEHSSLYLFTICHILKRPVIVYDDCVCESPREQSVSGIYLPICFGASKCYQNPIGLCRDSRGKFSALVAIRKIDGVKSSVFFPLATSQFERLSVKFVSESFTDHDFRSQKYSDYLIKKWLNAFMIAVNSVRTTVNDDDDDDDDDALATAQTPSSVNNVDAGAENDGNKIQCARQDLNVFANERNVMATKTDLQYDLRLYSNRFSCVL